MGRPMCADATSRPTTPPAIGSVRLTNDLILAPMVGYSDVPYRLICRQHGSALSHTPLMLDQAIIQLVRRGVSPVDFVQEERPVVVQLLSADPDTLAQAARLLGPLAPDVLDLNLGCPVPRVVARGRGAALLREPDKIRPLVEALVGAASCPVTAKIRLGWNQQELTYLQVARVLEEAGVAAIGVHGRTRSQGYSGEADWQAILDDHPGVFGKTGGAGAAAGGDAAGRGATGGPA